MRLHSSDLIELGWPPVGDMMEGVSEGTFISWQFNIPSFTQKDNGVGGTLRMFHPSTSGVITLLVDGESRLHELLGLAHSIDRFTKAIAFPLVAWDGNKNKIYTFVKASIVTRPPDSLGTGMRVVPWEFHFDRFFEQSFGFNANVVGR